VTDTSLDEVHGKKQLLERESDNALPIKTANSQVRVRSCAIVSIRGVKAQIKMKQFDDGTAYAGGRGESIIFIVL
jgi:hypothetical protein